MAKASDYAQCALTDDEAAATGRITKVWENEAWVLWQVDAGPDRLSGRRDRRVNMPPVSLPTPHPARDRSTT